jgi:Uri superfamily endonuclease
LAKRVGRHAKGEKKRRWHIDYLTAVATLDEVWYTVDNAHRECQWADALKRVRGAAVPLEGFGASDCCYRSHVFFFPKRPSLRAFRQGLAGSIRQHGPIGAVRPVLLGLLGTHGLMELGGEGLADTLTEGLLDELAGIPARLSGKTMGLDCGFALGVHDDLDGSTQATPPATWMVSFTEPSAKVCSVHWWPRRRASLAALQTAYA